MKDRWSQLSMSEKSDLMSLYIRNGISSLEEIKKHYNSFATGGQMNIDGSKEDENNKTYRTKQPLQEVNITADRPAWQRGLEPWDWSRARQYYSDENGYITPQGFAFLKNVASKRRTGKSDFMRDVDKLSYIPNAAVGAIGAIPAAAGLIASLPVVAEAAAPYVLPALKAVTPQVIGRFGLGMAGMAGTNQLVQDNTDYNSWGDMLNQVIFGQDDAVGSEILEFTNPGAFVGGVNANTFDRVSNLVSKASYVPKALTETYLPSKKQVQRFWNDITTKDLNHTPTQQRLYKTEFDAGLDFIDRRNKLDAERNEAFDHLTELQKKYHTKAYHLGLMPQGASMEQLSRVNFDKMNPEQMKTFFEKNARSNTDINKLLGEWDPVTKQFKETITYPTSAQNFDATNAVTTGKIKIKDLKTGNTQEFELDPNQLRTGSAINTDTYVFEGNQGNGMMLRNPYRLENRTIQTSESKKLNPTLPEGYADAVQKNIDYVTQEVVPGSKVFGSSASIAKGTLYHGSHDIDVIMTEAEAKKHPQFKSWSQVRPDTYTYNNNQAGNIDVNVIREDNGKATGELAHELYAQLYPKEYRDYMIKQAQKGPISTKTVLDKSPKELMDAYDPVTKTIMDSFASTKPKHRQRAYYYLHYGDIDSVRKGFESYANYLLGGEYKRLSIPVSEFKDPAVNSRLIDEFNLKGINKEQFVNDPERMQLLFDYVMHNKTFVGRGVDNSGDIIKSLTYWYPNTIGGTAHGVGLNTVVGGNSGHGNIYASIVPDRLQPLTATTPDAVIEQARHNLARQITPDNIKVIQDIANKHGVKLPSTISKLKDVLDATSNKTGENYKNFINELAQTFDISLIRNGNYGDGQYASLLEDQSINNIKQIFLNPLDRPQSIKARDEASINPFNGVIKPEPQTMWDIQDVLNNRSRSHSPKVQQDRWTEIIEKGKERIGRKFDEKEYKLLQDNGHKKQFEQIKENYIKYQKRLQTIRDAINYGTLATGAFCGTAGLIATFTKPKLADEYAVLPNVIKENVSKEEFKKLYKGDISFDEWFDNLPEKAKQITASQYYHLWKTYSLEDVPEPDKKVEDFDKDMVGFDKYLVDWINSKKGKKIVDYKKRRNSTSDFQNRTLNLNTMTIN